MQANREISEAFAHHFLARNPGALASLYTEQAVFMPPEEPAVTGREALGSWFGCLPPRAGIRVTLDEIDGREDLAYVRGTYSMTFAGPGGAPPAPLGGKFFEIRKRGPDSAWRLAVDTFNAGQP